MQDFQLAYEFPPGVYVGTVAVFAGDAIYWIRQPGQAVGWHNEIDDGLTWELHTDGFADIIVLPDGEPVVDRFSRSASNMQNPIPCWTRQHVESFVRRKLGV